MADVGVHSRLAAVFVIGLSLTALSAAGCAKVHARTIGPPLETPAPPPRVVPSASAPIESQPIVAPPVGEVQTPPPAAIATQEPPAAAPPAPAPAPQPPPLTLQTSGNPAAAEQRTRAALASAIRDLGRIDVRGLNADAKAQYDIARRFVTQATEALNAKNFEFAQQLADKAATLAALLQR